MKSTVISPTLLPTPWKKAVTILEQLLLLLPLQLGKKYVKYLYAKVK